MADPSVGVDLDGNLFVCGFYRPSAVEFVVRSTDGGATWNPTVVATTFPLDKPSVTINTNAGTPHENHIYFAYSDWATVPGPIKFSRSTDGGQNFSTPVSISGSVGLGKHVGVKHL
ncbi:MAG: exo-alpha-sialidase, partial [Ignavibacteriae bacterium]|nr:exo-alpha-sialidase [Ignavibacteriota bacterium]